MSVVIGLQCDGLYCSYRWKVARYACHEKPDQFRCHKVEIVGDFKTNDTLVVQVLFELRRELVSMRAFHDEDDIRPFNHLGSYGGCRPVVDTR